MYIATVYIYINNRHVKINSENIVNVQNVSESEITMNTKKNYHKHIASGISVHLIEIYSVRVLVLVSTMNYVMYVIENACIVFCCFFQSVHQCICTYFQDHSEHLHNINLYQFKITLNLCYNFFGDA